MTPSPIDVLKRSAERLRGRTLTPAEARALEDFYKQETGTDAQRAKEALRKSLGWSREDLREKRFASDDTDREFDDLENVLRPKRP